MARLEDGGGDLHYHRCALTGCNEFVECEDDCCEEDQETECYCCSQHEAAAVNKYL